MSQQMLRDRFFERLVQGDRSGARAIIEECLCAHVAAETILDRLVWPVYETVQKMHKDDQLSAICHHFATRMLRMFADQLQAKLTTLDRNGVRVLLLTGPREGDELAGQMAADLLEARGFEVFFAGGGIANDEIVGQIGQLRPGVLVLFGNAPTDLPYIRQLIDELHSISACPDMQVVVGGGVFNRAEGLAEEIGADLWAPTPTELVAAMEQSPSKRMVTSQRSVGRSRRTAAAAAA